MVDAELVPTNCNKLALIPALLAGIVTPREVPVISVSTLEVVVYNLAFAGELFK